MSRKVSVILTIYLLVSLAAFADKLSGIDLNKWWIEYKKQQAGLSYTIESSALYVGYVVGVVDALDGIAFALPIGTANSQFLDMVGKYLENSPENRNAAARLLIVKLMAATYPLPKE